MEDNIKYSIIIPHYNDIDGLKRLIPSIPKTNDIQIILIDDNSPDKKSVETEILNHSDRNIELYFNNPGKRGAGGCRNIGLSKATGKWLLFADADDYFTDNAFEVFDKHYNDVEDIIYFSMTSINLPNMTKGTRHIPNLCKIEDYVKSHSKEAEKQLRYEFHSPCAKLVRNEIVKENNILFEDVACGNDVMFSVKIGCFASSICAYAESVYCATRSAQTLTTKKSDELFKVRAEVHIRKILYLRNIMKEKDIYKYVIWPGTDIVRALSKGYGVGMAKYVIGRYVEEKIPVYHISLTRIIACIKRKSRIFLCRYNFLEK